MNSFYKNKYNKYKKKYINQKRQINNNSEIKEIDLYLYFDLLQVSSNIIKLTSKQDFLILVGESPSYLEPILKKERDLFILPFSNSPYGCFESPFGFPYDPPEEKIIKYKLPKKNKTLPSLDKQNNYFDYLN